MKRASDVINPHGNPNRYCKPILMASEPKRKIRYVLYCLSKHFTLVQKAYKFLSEFLLTDCYWETVAISVISKNVSVLVW